MTQDLMDYALLDFTRAVRSRAAAVATYRRNEADRRFRVHVARRRRALSARHPVR